MADFADRINRLRKAMDQGIADLRPFREHRKKFFEEWVGQNYSDGGAPDRVPVNFIELAASIYIRLLVSSTPQVSALTDIRQLRPSALELELAVNHMLTKMRLGDTLSECVTEAIFSMGIAKIGISDTGAEGEVGQYFVDSVSIQDWVHDTTASKYEQVSFAGNSYMVDMDVLQTHPYYDQEAKNSVFAAQKRAYDQRHEEKAESLSQSGTVHEDDSFHEKVEVWDVWLPKEGLISTMMKDTDGPALWTREWTGPERGPYKLLRYEKIPKNIMPLPPCASWYDIHELANRLFRKLARQAERQKRLLAVQGTNTEDGQKVMNASDGEAVVLMDPDRVKEINPSIGPDQGNLGFFLGLRGLFNMVSGNVEMLGGIAPSSDTLGQDKLLNQRGNEQMKKLADITYEFSEDICTDIGHYAWTDDLLDLPLCKRIPGTPFEAPFNWNYNSKQGEFFDYNLRIQPYSLTKPSPQERLSNVDRIMQQTLLPMMPILQQAGISIDFEAYLKMCGKYLNTPELDTIIKYAAEQTMAEPISSKSNSPRRYIRENVSRGRTDQAQAKEMAMVLASKQPKTETAGV